MRLLLALLILFAAAPAAAQGADPLVGLWGVRLDFGPALRGPIEVRRARNSWTATIGGARTSFAADRGEVRFDLGGRGGFRGRLTGAGIDGFWLQPVSASAESRDPGGAGQAFATPLHLRPAGRGVWRG
jgi:hypothetical protein